MQIKPSSGFKVLSNVRRQYPNFILEVTSTYEFSFDQVNNEELRKEVGKFSSRVNANCVKLGSAAKIIQEYTKVVPPLLFNLQGVSIVLCNHEDVKTKDKHKK